MFDDVKSTFEVPRVERPSRREFEERFLFPQRPVIISGSNDATVRLWDLATGAPVGDPVTDSICSSRWACG